MSISVLFLHSLTPPQVCKSQLRCLPAPCLIPAPESVSPAAAVVIFLKHTTDHVSPLPTMCFSPRLPQCAAQGSVAGPGGLPCLPLRCPRSVLGDFCPGGSSCWWFPPSPLCLPCLPDVLPLLAPPSHPFFTWLTLLHPVYSGHAPAPPPAFPGIPS